MFQGSYVALITPFLKGTIDEKSLRRIVEWHISEGTEGLVPLGTTGEAPTVDHSEYRQVLDIVVDQVKGRIPIIAGAGSNNTAEALRCAQTAERAGVDALLCVAGYYNRPSQEGLFEHFKHLHQHTDVPIVVYNIPPRTVVDISPETVARLAQLPRIVGIKDASMDASRVSLERQLIEKPFCYFSGEDITALAYNAMGGSGCISVTANIAPRLCAELQAACRINDYERARLLHEQLLPLHQALFLEPNPSAVKYAAARLGLCHDEVRLPMLNVSAATQHAVESALKDLSLAPLSAT